MGAPIIWFGTAAKLLKSTLTLPGSTSGTVSIAAPATPTTYSVTLPSLQGGSNTFLQNNGSGTLSWATASGSLAITSKTTTYTATTSDDVILCSSSAFTVTLPAASNTGKVLRIEKTDSTLANIITIARAGSDTINGATSIVLNLQYQSVTLIADGTATWYVSNTYLPTVYAKYRNTTNFAASTTIPVNYDTKVLDSHNSVTTSATAWKFTAPTADVYLVSGGWNNSGAGTSPQIYKNGSAVEFLFSSTAGSVISFSTIIQLSAGDFIDIRPNASITTSGASAGTVYINITSQGGS